MHLRSVENKSFVLLVVLVTLAFLWTIHGFLLPVFWAVVLAVIFWPLFVWLRSAFGGRPALASLVTLLVVLVTIVAPLVAIGAAVTGEAVALYGRIASGEVDVTAPIASVEAWLPELSRRAADYNVDLDQVQENVERAAVAASQRVAASLLTAGQGALNGVLMLVVAFYVLFFFLRDGDRLHRVLVRALPLGDVREETLFERFAAVTRATVRGTFVVAVVQGALGGIAFAALGLGAPVLWGVLMALLSLIPALGSALVWGPAALYLIATGAWVKGVILIAVGAGLIGLADNALRPMLVGREAGIPDYLILVSTLGGLATIGISGLVVGPILAGLFLTVWDLFADEFGGADVNGRGVRSEKGGHPPATADAPANEGLTGTAARAEAATDAPATNVPPADAPAASTPVADDSVRPGPDA